MLSSLEKVIRPFLLALTAIIVMTCSDNPEVKPNNPPVGQPLSDEDRIKVLEECATFVKQIGGLTSEAAQQVLVQWLMTKPEFEEAGISDNNVWAYFYDGRMAMFVPNWEGADEEGGRMAMPGGRTAINDNPSASAGRTQGLPQTNTVTLFQGLGKAFTEDRQFLKNLFTKSKKNYKVDILPASIENLKAVKDLGVFYIRTHGGVGQEKPKTAHNFAFGLWTTNPVTTVNDLTFRRDLDLYRLVYMLAVNDVVGQPVWNYGITREFVREYMTFSENAIQYIDACNSTAKPSAETFRESMMKKAANGKATYIGWTAPKSSIAGTPASRYIFDRLLAAHDAAVHMEDPEQRPFDVAAIFPDLKSFNLGVSVHGGVINYYTTATTKAILAPSIEYIDVDDFESRIIIKGLFGDDPGADGKVTVDGIAVPVSHWTAELLVCQLPDTGPGSSGDVIVSVRDNKSNVVPLSEWTIPLNISKDELGLTTEAILNLRLRADIHSYRSKPGESPKPPKGDSLALALKETLGAPFAIGSGGTYAVGGQSRVTCPLGLCKLSDNKAVINKNGKLPYLRVSNGFGFAAYYKWSMDMKKLYIKLDVNIPDIGVEYESITACPNVEPATANYSAPATFGIHIPTDKITMLELNLDDKFTITSGSISKSHAGPPADCVGTLQMETKASWSSVYAAFPPKKDTEARIPE